MDMTAAGAHEATESRGEESIRRMTGDCTSRVHFAVQRNLGTYAVLSTPHGEEARLRRLEP